jgi:hypothetical protein
VRRLYGCASPRLINEGLMRELWSGWAMTDTYSS